MIILNIKSVISQLYVSSVFKLKLSYSINYCPATVANLFLLTMFIVFVNPYLHIQQN